MSDTFFDVGERDSCTLCFHTDFDVWGNGTRVYLFPISSLIFGKDRLCVCVGVCVCVCACVCACVCVCMCVCARSRVYVYARARVRC